MQDIQELRGSLRSPHSPKKRPRRLHARRPVPPPKPAAPPSLEAGELPESYGEDKVVVLPVNPYLVHVYWDLAPRHQSQANTPACLRFSEPGGSGSFDVNIDLAAKSWYVHLWSPEKRYSVELGLNPPDGEFVSLARSNHVETPRAWPVAEVHEQFRRVENSQAAGAAVPSEPPVPVLPAVPVIAAETEQAIFPPPEPPALIANPRQEEHRGDPQFAPPPATDRDTTPQAAPASGPHRIPSPDAGAVLRQRLTELYALRWGREWPGGVSASVARDFPPPPERPPAQGPGAERLAAERLPADLLPPRLEPADLTSRVEHHFAPGFSSSLLALHGPDRPAD